MAPSSRRSPLFAARHFKKPSVGTAPMRRTLTSQRPAWRPRRALEIALGVLLLWLFVFRTDTHVVTVSQIGTNNKDPHPITGLLRDATDEAVSRQTARSSSLGQAVQSYRARYLRDPPPGFDAWYRAAVSANACNIDRFDEMMQSLEVFWALSPEEIRHKQDQLKRLIGLVRVRNGRVTKWDPALHHESEWGKAGEGNQREAFERLLDEVRTTFGFDDLPDVDLWVNPMDEPRVLYPYELKSDLLAMARAGTVRPFTDEHLVQYDIARDERSGMEILSSACPPDSPTRLFFEKNAQRIDPTQDYAAPFSTSQGHFLSNAFQELDYCQQPDLWNLSASMLQPLSMPWIPQVFPIFSMTKLHGWGDIMIPPWYYCWETGGAPTRFYDFPHWSEGIDAPWSHKWDKVFWRGTLNGGLPKGDRINGWIRTRLVRQLKVPEENSQMTSMLATTGPEVPFGQAPDMISLTAPSAALSRGYGDAAVTLHDWQHADDSTLAMLKADKSLEVVGSVGYDYVLKNKLLLDLDGTSFSGRFLMLQNSSSAVMKVRLFKEFLDDTLVPWYHYIPLGVRIRETWNIIGYFFGARNILEVLGQATLGKKAYALVKASHGHDGQLRSIGRQGQKWVRSCARREDFVLYAWRLVLEWARLCSDDRKNLNFRMSAVTEDPLRMDAAALKAKFGRIREAPPARPDTDAARDRGLGDDDEVEVEQ